MASSWVPRIKPPSRPSSAKSASAPSGGSVLRRVNQPSTAIQRAARPPAAPSLAPAPMDTGGGSGGEGGLPEPTQTTTTTNPLSNPQYMTYVNELIRQRGEAEAQRENQLNNITQTYGMQTQRVNDLAPQQRTKIDEGWAGRGLTRSGARLEDQQLYADAIKRQLADIMLAEQEQRNAVEMAYQAAQQEARRRQAELALQYGVPLTSTDPTMIPV